MRWFGRACRNLIMTMKEEKSILAVVVKTVCMLAMLLPMKMYGQTLPAAITLLDITQRDREQEDGASGRNLYSAQYMLEVAGFPFNVTALLDSALSHSDCILLSSKVLPSTFKEEEISAIRSWVERGGMLMSPACTTADEPFGSLFGISSATSSRYRYAFGWDTSLAGKGELAYVDTPEEDTVSIGRIGRECIESYGYTTGEGEPMAQFNTGETAVVCRKIGRGRIYLFGVAWRDVIQRNQLNKDFHAQRQGSNGFEPSADAFPLFLRAALVKHRGIAVWKHTIPAGLESVLIPTHDCDSRTAYDAMHYMADYESSIGLRSHFFLTAHFYRDKGYLSAFYDSASIAKAKALLAAGHTIGSHSIGHFPDFDHKERFPAIVTAREEYRPHHDVDANLTTGGSSWAEIVLSKQIIESDLGNKVRSFRTGHLCMNDNVPEMEEKGGYEFSSCYTATDVLSEYPFLEREQNDWTGRQTGVLQMPLHFSDVFNAAAGKMDSTNWKQKPAVWLTILNKLRGNYAPAILLVHPNRQWKMKAEKMLVDSMDSNVVGLCNFEDYGDFWTARRKLNYSYTVDETNSRVVIIVKKADITDNWNIDFVVERSGGAVPYSIVLQDEDGKEYQIETHKLSDTRTAVTLTTHTGIRKVNVDATTASPQYTLGGLPGEPGYSGIVVGRGKKNVCR